MDAARTRRLLAGLVVSLSTACTPIAPFRTHIDSVSSIDPSTRCASLTQAQPNDGQLSNHERTPAYDLYFVEFDELGLLYPATMSRAGSASRHIQALMEDLELLANSCVGLSLVVYVHGWKHNASTDDENVKSFRQLLLDAALVEEGKKEEYGLPPHRVVGVFVSWRGDSLSLPEPFKSLTFWDRKRTAQRVAEGESRTLFSRLRGFEARQNKADTQSPEKKVFTILMGHSFGGLILFNSVSGSLINALFDNPPEGTAREDVIPRVGDMIVLANPAVEATRYASLHRAVLARPRFNSYQPPIFVSITSTADWATRIAFPLGEELGTMFQTKLSDEEREANRTTIGHMDAYVTHELKKRGDDQETCPGWIPIKDPSDPAAIAQEKINLDLERKSSKDFFGDDPDHLSLPPAWTRHFCGNSVLTHLAFDPYSLIWNVRTNHDLVPDHSTITTPEFVNFVRQLYHDALIYRLIIERAKSQRLKNR